MTESALVLGAGVSGLSSALRLAQQGFAVRVWTAEPPLDTTSSVAAAFWYPYLAQPLARVARWAEHSLAEFNRLAAIPETGIRIRPATVLYDAAEDDPVWQTSSLKPQPLPASALPHGVAAGFTLDVPVIDMPVYLEWLTGEVRARGVELEIRRLASLAPALAAAPIVVNCTGLGSRSLVGDDNL
jgi:D-amino-acid oxidase